MRVSLAGLLSLFLLGASLSLGAEVKPVRPGEVAPEFSFLDTDRVRRNVTDLPVREAYVFFFGLLDCPLARRLAPTLAALSKEFRPKGVEFVGLLGTPSDSILDVASYRVEMNLPFLVGKDIPEPNVSAPETESFAGQILGITHSPQVVVLDAKRRLIYRGRVDGRLGVMGSRANANEKEGELHRALRLLVAGTPEISETPSEGCQMRWEMPALPDGKNLTFYKDVQPILKRGCWDCHYKGGEGPFPLVTYKEASTHAETILSVVRSEVMPPAYDQKKAFRFTNHRELSDQDKGILESWIRNGTPEGNPSDASVAPPSEARGWKIGTPDLILTYPKEFKIPAEGKDLYLTSVLKHVFWRDTWVESIEIFPTNRRVTHHVNLVYWSLARYLRKGEGASVETMLTGYAPGAPPMETRKVGPNIGVRIPAGSVLGCLVHLVPTGKADSTNIKIGIRFAKQPIRKQLHNVLFYRTDFKIPAGDGDYRISVNQTLPHDMNLVGFFPHMHLRGKAMWLNAGPKNGVEKRLLEIPTYNFSWQMAYLLPPDGAQKGNDADVPCPLRQLRDEHLQSRSYSDGAPRRADAGRDVHGISPLLAAGGEAEPQDRSQDRPHQAVVRLGRNESEAD